MRHALLHILALTLVLAVLPSCDFIRTLAGRPTSADIEAIRRIIEEDDSLMTARRDSVESALEAARQAEADSLAALDSFALAGCHFRTSAELGGLDSACTLSRYAIAVGAFRKVSNARKMAQRFDADKYSPTVVVAGSGLNIVLVCPADKIKDLYVSYSRFRGEPLCPKDAWVLVNQNVNDVQ